MSELLIQEFTNQLFGNVRTIIDQNGNPWFIANDIASCLGYSRPNDAIADHVDIVDKQSININNTTSNHRRTSGNPNMIIINESGLYSLIFSSKLPIAKEFKHWVTSEVLPAMRQIGFDKSMNMMKQELDRLKGTNAKLTKENYELNTAYNGLQVSFANQSADFAFNTDARNQIIEKIMSVSWLTPEQKQFLIKYEGE